ncbi:unnamed protein product [Dicrocoelium dendriticum]|nr:unnamed protein product [Dicrocoelium dendriticum]
MQTLSRTSHATAIALAARALARASTRTLAAGLRSPTARALTLGATPAAMRVRIAPRPRSVSRAAARGQDAPVPAIGAARTRRFAWPRYFARRPHTRRPARRPGRTRTRRDRARDRPLRSPQSRRRRAPARAALRVVAPRRRIALRDGRRAPHGRSAHGAGACVRVPAVAIAPPRPPVRAAVPAPRHSPGARSPAAAIA